MKYILTFLIFILMLAGCSTVDIPAETPVNTPAVIPSQSTIQDGLNSIDFTVYYSRIFGGPDFAGTSDVLVFKNAANLKVYADAILESENYIDNLFDEDVSSPFLFSDITKYDDSYFENSVLIIVRLTEPSGSIRHNVAAVETIDDTTTVHLERIIPLAQTDDMADWQIIIEAPTADIADNVELNLHDYNKDIDMLTITSGNITYYELYHRNYSSATYDPDYGDTLFADSEPFNPAEVLKNLSIVEWSNNFEFNTYPNCSVRYFRIYNDTLTDYNDQTETLDISQFNKPGTYPVRFVAYWTLGTRYGADRPDTVSEEYFFLLNIGEEDLQ